jgi:hypothetical protein
MIVVALALSLLTSASALSEPHGEAGAIQDVTALRARYGLDERAERMLKQNGFVVLDGGVSTLQDAYPREHHVTPMYVSGDAMLLLWFGLQQDLMKQAESGALTESIRQALPALVRETALIGRRATDGRTAADANRAIVALAVAEQLIDGDEQKASGAPAELRSEIDRAVALVMAHNETDDYPGEDYTQYTIRGHYTDSPALGRYFLASMWLSRRLFAVDHVPGPDRDAPLRQAIVLAAALRAAGPETQGQIRTLLEVRHALGGPANTISITELGRALDACLGPGWTVERAVRAEGLAAVRAELQKAEYPRSGVWAASVYQGSTPWPSQIVTFLPPSALPDSLLFQSTVNPAIRDRSLPTGLEVGAALGFGVAREEISAHDKYAAAVLKQADAHSPAIRSGGSDLYSGWMRALSALTDVPAGAPEFMRSRAWQYGRLSTALAGWAQLRHAYVLYGAQTYAMTVGKQEPVAAMVEPNPELYRHLAGLAKTVRTALAPAGGPGADTRRLAAFEAKCVEFERLAGAELNGGLTPAQAQSIDEFGEWLSQFADVKAAQIADVATGMSLEVLHAASGNLHTILVMPDRKSGRVFIGAVQSYYEFSRPHGMRLTDQEWRALNASTLLSPEPPAWQSAFLASPRAEDWELRAPLRAAEALLLKGKAEEGLAQLREIAATRRDSPISTEAQCRIGKFYLDAGDPSRASLELSKCARMYGCDASDLADQLARQARLEEQRREFDRQRAQRLDSVDATFEPLRPGQSPEPPGQWLTIKRLRADLAEVRSGAGVPAAEKRLTQDLLGSTPWAAERPETTIEGLDRTEALVGLLTDASRAVKSPEYRQALGYAAVLAGWQLRYMVASQGAGAPYVQLAIAFWNSDAPEPLRAAALGIALEGGYLADDTRRAEALVRPLLHSAVFSSVHESPAEMALKAMSRNSDTGPEPESLFGLGAHVVLCRLLVAEWHAGRSAEAEKIAKSMPAGDNIMNYQAESAVAEFLRCWDRYGANDRAVADAIGLVKGLDEAGRDAEAARVLIAFAEANPKSTLAPQALGHAALRLRQAGQEQRSRELLRRLRTVYPQSVPGLIQRILEADRTGDLPLMRSLLPQMNALYWREDRPDTVWTVADEDTAMRLAEDIGLYDARRQALKPLIDAAGNPKALTRQIMLGDGRAVSEILARALPRRVPEVLLEVGKACGNADLIRRVLTQFPASSSARRAWTVAESHAGNHGELLDHLGFPRGVELLAPAVNGWPGEISDSATNTLLNEIGGVHAWDLRYVAQIDRVVHNEFPKSRIAAAVDLAEARVMLTRKRPEALLSVAQAVMAATAASDPLHQEAKALIAKARTQIAEKGRPELLACWTVRVPIARGVFRLQGTDPRLDAGNVYVPGAGEDGRAQVVAIGLDSGRTNWISALPSALCSFDLGTGGVYCLTEDGSVTKLDRGTGKAIWRREPDAGSAGVVAVGDVPVLFGRSGLLALSPNDGSLRWRHADWRLPELGREINGAPAATGDTLFVGCDDASVRAIWASSGALRWQRAYPMPDPAHPDRRSRVPTLVSQPMLTSDAVVVTTIRPAPQLEMLDAATGKVRATAALTPQFQNGIQQHPSDSSSVEWVAGGANALWRPFDRTPFRVHVLDLRNLGILGAAGRLAFSCDGQRQLLQVYEPATGALASEGETDAAGPLSVIAVGHGYVVVRSPDGRVGAFRAPDSGRTLN